MGTFSVTETNNPVTFTVGKDTFEALPADKVPASIISSYFKLLGEGEIFKAHDVFFKEVLTTDSHKKFYLGLNSKQTPITISILGEIVAWLIGDEYFGGKSFGRSQAIIHFSLDVWDEFDSWCLMHGIKENPWSLPSYRFGALVIAFMKDDKTQEGLDQIDESLRGVDYAPHPFADSSFKATLKAMGSVLSTPPLAKTRSIVDNVIYDSRFSNLPIEEQKRREAAAAGKPYKVPEWWKGEKAAYKTAQLMMKTLPKKISP